MVRWSALIVALCACAGLIACNKQKPPKLDYTEKLQAGVYSPHGLPGETAPGTPESDAKYMKTATGHPEDGASDSSQKPKDEPPKDEAAKDEGGSSESK